MAGRSPTTSQVVLGDVILVLKSFGPINRKMKTSVYLIVLDVIEGYIV